MFFGTDLAAERQRMVGELPGLEKNEYTVGDAAVSEITVPDGEASRSLGRPAGKYVTVAVPSMDVTRRIFDGRVRALADCLEKMLPAEGKILFVGLGNPDITSDAFGPLTAGKILATGHLGADEIKKARLPAVRPVCVLAPGVAGDTGMEAADIVRSVCADLKPSAVIAADALAAGDLARVGCTFQLTDTGISPGSGVKNARKRLDGETLGVPVIALGVPTVINAVRAAECIFGKTLETPPQREYADTVVTVREADKMVARAAAMAGAAVNLALQPGLTAEELAELTA